MNIYQGSRVGTNVIVAVITDNCELATETELTMNWPLVSNGYLTRDSWRILWDMKQKY